MSDSGSPAIREDRMTAEARAKQAAAQAAPLEASVPIGRTPPVDDATVVIGKTSPADDATVVIGASDMPAGAPSPAASVSGDEPNPTHRAGKIPAADISISSKTGASLRTAARPLPNARADDSSLTRRNGGAKSGKRPQNSGAGGFLGAVANELVARGVLPEREAISLALRARDHGQTFLYAMALDAGFASDEKLYAVLAERLGTRLINSRRELLENVADVNWLDAKSAEQRGVLLLHVPDSEESDAVEYAALDPCDVMLRDWLKTRTGKPIKPVVVLPSAFFEAMTNLKARIEAPKRGDESLIPIDVSWQQESLLLDQPLSADIPLIVNYILQKSQEQDASDVHLEPSDKGMLVRVRVDGILHELTRMPLELHSAVVSRIKVMAGMDVAERRRPQDGRISIVVRKSPIDVRVSTLPTVLGEKVVMRLLSDEALRPSPEQLGIRGQNLRMILDKITAPLGLIMISGPTGSGKTTTLYTCLSAADRAHRNVVTVEDPVEYRLNGVHQMQVNEKIGLTFASGLRTLLRQDPDVIMVGECRDSETGHMAVQAALTGHVVFSTIHANDCISVITRLLDMRIDAFLVASALSLSISQRLVRVSCKHCAVMVDGREVLRLLRADGVSAEKMQRLGMNIDEKMPCMQPAGCAHCRHTGYSGRQAVYEMLEITSEIRKLIVSDNFEVDALRALARDSGMVPMIGHGLQLVEEGRTTYPELIRVFGDG
jgi:type IV pilus assembly protein PilB